MQGLEIKSIDIRQSHHLRGASSATFISALSNQLSSLCVELVRRSTADNFAHYLCSSTFDIVCSGEWFEPKELCYKVAQQTGINCSFSNALQCATWGSLVRQHLTNKPDCPDLIISIIDANPLNMKFWDENQLWGKTSHRVTQIHLHIPDTTPSAEVVLNINNTTRNQELAIINDQQPIAEIVACNPSAILYDYAAALNKAAKRYTAHTMCIPYFEKKMRKGLKRTLKEYPHIADKYEQYGHVCGSDPWISVATDNVENVENDKKSKQYLLSSLASHGYVCFLSAHTTPLTHINLEE